MGFSWKGFLTLLLVATITALIIGNLIYYVGSDYIIPGIHLDLMTFVYLLGYGTTVMIVALLLTKQNRRRRH